MFKNTPSTSWLARPVVNIVAPLRGTIAEKKINLENETMKISTCYKKNQIVLSALFSNMERDAAGDDLSVENLSRANSSSDLNTNNELNPTANHLGTQSD